MSQEEDGPQLKCRMYESRYPAEGDIVLGKVKHIEGREAVVHLVEYRKRSNLVLSAVVPPVRVLTLGRKEAFRVAHVDTESRVITLDEEPVPLVDLWAFEKRFNEAKFVHSVIFSVADEMKMDLKDAYKLAGWPSFENLKSLHNDQRFSACENVQFRTQLLQRIKLMRYNSWRIRDPSRLQTCALKQLRDICYAIALTRQAEAFFKQNGDLGREEYLSVQEVLYKAVDRGLVFNDFTLSEMERLALELQRKGFILDTDCPLTYSLKRSPTSSDSTTGPVRVFKAPQIKVVTVGEDCPEEWMAETILGELEEEPITCSVRMFPSYKNKSKKLLDIYEPTEEELAAYELARDEGKPQKLDLHTMLLSGDGVDRYGKHYLEFQDSLGDVGNGDRGYIRFAVKPNTVNECVFFKNFHNNDEL